ncbi:Uncharacterized protein TCM_013044 [Theobroma cacao]|uniref:Uncharacterized protein n=1 Tax=Theobroma cacao TaxID=3641 RepID=A0A061FX77_THECC|nr:Uncharacterized protein TCM_013044 [Theobroma cacao]
MFKMFFFTIRKEPQVTPKAYILQKHDIKCDSGNSRQVSYGEGLGLRRVRFKASSVLGERCTGIGAFFSLAFSTRFLSILN